MEKIREAYFANLYYPEDSINLKRLLNNFLSNVPNEVSEFYKKNNIDHFFGFIVPHASYKYSGSVSAFAFSLLKQKKIDTVFLIGPSHYTNFEGFALPYYKLFRTPLGDVKVENKLLEEIVLESNGIFDFIDSAHKNEFCLEVQLPFLQEVIEENFSIVPILISEIQVEKIKKAVDIIYKKILNYEKNVLFISTSDFSHYNNLENSRKMDEELCKLIEIMDSNEILNKYNKSEIEACGINSILFLLEISKKFKKKNVKILNYNNYSDDKRYVGYISAAIW